MHSEGYCSWVCVFVCVCPLLNISNVCWYHMLNGQQRSLKKLRSRARALPAMRAGAVCNLMRKTRMRIKFSDGIGHFVSRSVWRDFVSCCLYLLLTIMPPSKVCPQCEAVSCTDKAESV